MRPTQKNIERLFNVIDNSVFMITGKLDYDRVTDAIIKLANAVHEFTDDTDQIWYIGEFRHCCLADFIVGAYWHFTEWHSGQSSKSYLALCALGQVFSPGMTGTEKDNLAYIELNYMAENFH